MSNAVRILFAGILALASPAHAADAIWSALVLATNETPAREAPRKLAPFADNIREVFGYNSLYLLGDQREEFHPGTRSRLVPGRGFSFEITCHSRDETRYAVALELFHDENPLVNAETRLARNAPLFIRGPQWGAGRIIILLEVR